MSDPFAEKRDAMRSAGFVPQARIASLVDALDVVDEMGACELRRPHRVRGDNLDVIARLRRSVEREEPTPRIRGQIRMLLPRLGPDARERALLLLAHCLDDDAPTN